MLKAKPIFTTINRALSTTPNLSSVIQAQEQAKTKKEEYYSKIGQADDTKPENWDKAKPFDQIPGPKALPFIGIAHKFLPFGEFYKKPFLEVFRSFQKDYGDVVSFKTFSKKDHLTLIYNLEDFEPFLRSESAWPLRDILPNLRSFRTIYKKDMFKGTPGLLGVNGEEWFKFRSKVNPILMQPKNVFMYVGTIDKIAKELVGNISYLASLNEKGEMPEDFLLQLNKYTLEATTFIALDKRFGCLDRDLKKDSDAYIYLTTVLRFFDLMVLVDLHPAKEFFFYKKREYFKLLDNLTNLSAKYINESIEKLKTKREGEQLTILEQLIQKDPKTALPMVADMMFAGVEATAKTLAAALYFLSRYPEVQQKLRQEVMEVMPSKETIITKESLSKMPYLKAVVKETTRLAPVPFAHVRTMQRDVVLGGYQIPKGTKVMSHQLFASTSEKYVKESSRFMPERWLRGQESEYSVDPLLVLPFGFGPRSCIGRRIATMELEVAIVEIIRNFEMSWPHKDMTFTLKLAYGIDDPLKIHMKPLKI